MAVKRYFTLITTTVLLAMGSCALVSVDPDKTYRKDLAFAVNGAKAIGTHVVNAKASRYNIKFELPTKPFLVKITSCHREVILQDPGSSFEYAYLPVPGLEDVGLCYLDITSYSSSGLVQWGSIDFSLEKGLNALVGCNGEHALTNGATYCQSRHNLIQTLAFAHSVKHRVSQGCPAPEVTDNDRFYKIPLAKGTCLYVFSDGSADHRLTTYGYDEVLIP